MAAKATETMAPQLQEWAELGWLYFVGGCCGPPPDHIRKIASLVKHCAPRVAPSREPLLRLSGLEAVTLRPDSNFVNIGERTNVTGSPRFSKLILAGDYEPALAIALTPAVPPVRRLLQLRVSKWRTVRS